MNLGKVGIWTFAFDATPWPRAVEVLAEVEELGYGALWVPEVVAKDALVHSALLLSASERIVIATGIASIWARGPLAMSQAHKTITEAHPDRFLLGVGVSHQPVVEGYHGSDYSKPYSKMREYLDAMDQATYFAAPPTTEPQRVLAALGPRMLGLAATRANGAHPYFVPVEHTAFARSLLGDGSLLCPEQAVALTTDANEARSLARTHMRMYLGLPNYTNNLRRFGYGDEDFADGGSDRLFDAIVAWGDVDAIAARVKAHHDAGADHVCIQVLGDSPAHLPLAEWRELAPALVG
jgi:probable F420-dependent oxidoreductase